METQVFESYYAFLRRPNKDINGVSEDFARSNPHFEEDNQTNIGCWNSLNSRNCTYCINLLNCYACHDSSDLSYSRHCRNEVGDLEIPIVENIHSKVFEATKNGKLLDMKSWHSKCGTTHCRAGWAVALAGEKGSKLESQTSTPFAARCIYSKSSNIQVPSSHFYLSNEESMKDIALCAKLEREGKSGRN